MVPLSYVLPMMFFIKRHETEGFLLEIKVYTFLPQQREKEGSVSVHGIVKKKKERKGKAKSINIEFLSLL